MGLFRSDFYRSLALGFVVGALGVVAAMGIGSNGISDSVVPPAQAAAPAHP